MEAIAVVNEHWDYCQSRPGQKQVLTDSIQSSLRCSMLPLTQLKFLDLHSESLGFYKKNSIYTRRSHNKLSRRPMVKSKSHKECLSSVDKATQGLGCYRERNQHAVSTICRDLQAGSTIAPPPFQQGWVSLLPSQTLVSPSAPTNRSAMQMEFNESF